MGSTSRDAPVSAIGGSVVDRDIGGSIAGHAPQGLRSSA
jgi:hypothetical protein